MKADLCQSAFFYSFGLGSIYVFYIMQNKINLRTQEINL